MKFPVLLRWHFRPHYNTKILLPKYINQAVTINFFSMNHPLYTYLCSLNNLIWRNKFHTLEIVSAICMFLRHYYCRARTLISHALFLSLCTISISIRFPKASRFFNVIIILCQRLWIHGCFTYTSIISNTRGPQSKSFKTHQRIGHCLFLIRSPSVQKILTKFKK